MPLSESVIVLHGELYYHSPVESKRLEKQQTERRQERGRAGHLLSTIHTDNVHSFFSTDIANRVMHEMQSVVASAYIAIDIGIGSFASLADGALMTYLLQKSPVGMEVRSRSTALPFVMWLLFGIFGLASIATKGTQIWSIFEQIDSSNDNDSGSDSASDIHEFGSQVTAQDINTAAAGMQLLFAILYFVFTFWYLRRVKGHSATKTLIATIVTLGMAYLVRNIVCFVFVLLYSQYNHTDPLGVQLVYLAFYGILSVVIFCDILWIATLQEKGEMVRPGDHQPNFTSDRPVWKPEKPSIMIDPVVNRLYQGTQWSGYHAAPTAYDSADDSHRCGYNTPPMHYMG